jgi:hypothetical protein
MVFIVVTVALAFKIFVLKEVDFNFPEIAAIYMIVWLLPVAFLLLDFS